MKKVAKKKAAGKAITKAKPQEMTAANTTAQTYLAVIEQSGQVMLTLKRAIDEGKDIETVERLFALSQKINADNAEKIFYEALRVCRAALPPIPSRGDNEGKAYPLFEDMLELCMPIISDHGFHLSYDTEPSHLETYIRTVGDLSHNCGHTRRFQIDLPPDGVGQKGTPNKTPIHSVSSSMTYACRILFKQIWNLQVTKDPTDNDGGPIGQAAEEKLLSVAQLKTLTMKLAEAKSKAKPLLDFFAIQKLDQLPQSRLKEAIALLDSRITRNSEGEK